MVRSLPWTRFPERLAELVIPVVTTVTCIAQVAPSTFNGAKIDVVTTVPKARYPLALAQNMVSTGLIIWRVWAQHRMSQTVGLQVVNGVSLLEVIAIMLESASAYTVQLILVNIGEFVGHPIRFIAQATTVPTAG